MNNYELFGFSLIFSWQLFYELEYFSFLEALCNSREYELTSLETEVLMYLKESHCPTKKIYWQPILHHIP
ncbi:hypothetical protein BV378_01585 [Nostoc sp. RF31YmG]|nr:hypothetical protein BV378_01585 [Nostoc sp. RF31YmG]